MNNTHDFPRGLALVIGVPEYVGPLLNCPPGSVKLVFRTQELAVAYVRNPGSVRCFEVRTDGVHLYACHEYAAHYRSTVQ